jgi:hypothetical protein
MKLYYILQQIKYIIGCKEVESGNPVTLISQHRVRLPRTCLPVGEARNLRSLECSLHDRSHHLQVELFIRGVLIKRRIEIELVFLHVLG